MRWLPLLLLLLPGLGVAATWEVTSTPPGAEVWACPADQPVAYRKGITPCRVEAGGEVSALILRKPGYFDAYPTVPPEGGPVAVALAAKRDPAVWARMYRGAPPDATWDAIANARWGISGGRAEARELADGPSLDDQVEDWSPDGRALLTQTYVWGFWLKQTGLVPKEGSLSDLWWVPLQGQPARVWRLRAEKSGFILSGCFAPGGRWIAHSGPVGDRERLRLWRVDKQTGPEIAAEPGASLYSPHFSPSGNLLVCVRELPGSPDRRDPNRYDLALMHWNGSGRRALGVDADEDVPPSFSPDEQQLAFASRAGELCLIPVAGGQAHRLGDAPGWKVLDTPRWSPDGRRVAVTLGAGEGGGPDSDLVRVVWADVQDGATGTIRAARVRDWVDDNHLAVQASTWSAEAGVAYQRILSVDLQGQLDTVLWQPRTLLHAPVMSPSGKRVAALARAETGECVYLYDSEAAAGRFLAEDAPAPWTGLAWANETMLLLTRDRDGKPVSWLLDTQSGTLARTDASPAAVAYVGEVRFRCVGGDLYEGGAAGPGQPPGYREGEVAVTHFSLPPDADVPPSEVPGS
jgi:hypothetical protein